MNAILGFFATIISYPLKLIYLLVNNYGLSVIILTLLVRACMVPLYAKQIKSQAMMSEIQPRIQEIQRKYARDRELMNEKMQEVYAKYHYNPMSGCLPLLIQMPIIMGLFALLRTPLSYMTEASMVAAVHESFLWISDLSQPDNWILPLLAGVTTYFTYVASSSTMSGDQAGMMKAMQYVFPIMIFAWGRTYPAGLALYWGVGNLFTIVQTFILNKQRKRDRFISDARQEAMRNVKREAAN
ncbi:MAG: membrane protein insertase YidC [Firmicutes bacterium]|jgi:YidC/Oxa1 family membrane protein insertase|nr:membrane protein insertase YidC [Ruminococcus sp.]MBR4150428.1 membrane protein insertase YidC [Bacillota bacterium]